MAKLIDPLKELQAARQEEGSLGAAQIAGLAPLPKKDLKADTHLSDESFLAKVAAIPKAISTDPKLHAAICKDFRVFLTLVWRHLLGNDPNPIQLDLAYWLQHGPDRAIIMAFRGFSKSWITGAYALWCLYVNPDEKVMVVSGSLKRAVATTNWALSLILTMPELAHMKPPPHYRASSAQFDVGTCVPAQSASFSAFGIGGQLVGFRGSVIIPDDVETQTNSLSVVGREKIEEAVKEFESVLVPGGRIKYLGTPHDVDSLYLKLLKLRGEDGSQIYQARIWTAHYPTSEQLKSYKGMLAPYITHMMNKLGPSCIGKSTMPMRFTDADLAIRKAAVGPSEYALQFMLDLSGLTLSKYPLKLSNLIVMALDDRKGPDSVVWGDKNVMRDLPVIGLDGDFLYGPNYTSGEYVKYTRVIAVVDSSGTGDDETVMAIMAELNGTLFLLHMYASKDGYEQHVLDKMASIIVRFRAHQVYIEKNFGDGMFAALLRPVLIKAWKAAESRARSAGTVHRDDVWASAVEDVAVGKNQKEKRILGILEPVTYQHRLVVSKDVILWDEESIKEMEGEEGRHRYSFGFQFTHLTRERDSLKHDDRVDTLATACSMFADVLGVDPQGISVQRREERQDEWLQKLLDEQDDLMGHSSVKRDDGRMEAAKAQRR